MQTAAATSIFPRRKVCRAGRFAAAASERVVPANQTTVPRRPNENNDAIVSLNFKGHIPAHGVAARGKCPRPDLRRLKTGTDLKKRCSTKAKDALRICGALSQCDCEAVGISCLTG